MENDKRCGTCKHFRAYSKTTQASDVCEIPLPEWVVLAIGDFCMDSDYNVVSKSSGKGCSTWQPIQSNQEGEAKQ